MFARALPFVKRSISALTLATIVVGASGCQLSLSGKTDAFVVERESKTAGSKPKKSAKPKAKPKSDAKKVVREAGPIWNNDDAQGKCRKTCDELAWEGVWWTTEWNEMSVCECVVK